MPLHYVTSYNKFKEIHQNCADIKAHIKKGYTREESKQKTFDPFIQQLYTMFLCTINIKKYLKTALIKAHT